LHRAEAEAPSQGKAMLGHRPPDAAGVTPRIDHESGIGDV
jgi:hypothetical protein